MHTNMLPEIVVREILDTGPFRPGVPMFVADGPDGHTWLLKRTTEDAARRDGLAYFLATRTRDASGRWVIDSVSPR